MARWKQVVTALPATEHILRQQGLPEASQGILFAIASMLLHAWQKSAACHGTYFGGNTLVVLNQVSTLAGQVVTGSAVGRSP